MFAKSIFINRLAEFVTLDTAGDNRLSRQEFEQANRLAEFLGMTVDDIGHLFTKVDVQMIGFPMTRYAFNTLLKRFKNYQPVPSHIIDTALIPKNPYIL